jgi:hypothetical protein
MDGNKEEPYGKTQCGFYDDFLTEGKGIKKGLFGNNIHQFYRRI